jgi:hypothetical protein
MRIELIYNINDCCSGYKLLPDNNEDEKIIKELKNLFWLGEALAVIDESTSDFTMIDDELASAPLWTDDDI